MIRCIALLLLLVTSAQADALKVGFVDMPPFSWQQEDGTWTGVAVDLWTRTAESAGIAWTAVKADTPNGLVEQLAAGTIDVAATGLTVTAERARHVDFLPSFELNSVGIVSRPAEGLQFWHLLAGLTDAAFLGMSVLVVSLIVVFGVAIWLAERRGNPGEFGGGHHHGLGSGLWWSMVTMSTVGYGDKSPRTWAGRMIAGLWIVMALVLVSVFTGAAASVFTQRTSDTVAHTWSLKGRSVGALADGSTQSWLRTKGVKARGYPTSIEGVQAVQRGEIDVFAGDVSMLRWVLLEQYIDDLEVLDGLKQERLSLAIRPGLAQERDLTVHMLQVMASPAWADSLRAHGWPSSEMIH